MMILACAIIMLHAVIPHHHHDCCGTMGIVFEKEVNCHCDDEMDAHKECHEHSGLCHHEHDSHHPFDLCMLQELLSHLVLSNKEDETYLALSTIAVHDIFVAVIPDLIRLELTEPLTFYSQHPIVDVALPLDIVEHGSPLRAPPLV